MGAVPQEFDGLLRRCRNRRKESLPVHWAYSGVLNGQPILAIANGAGGRRAFAAVGRPGLEMVCSIGFCGALDPALAVGEILVVSHVNGEAISLPRRAAPATTARLASIDRVASTKEEKRVLRQSGALAVDMEAAGALKRTRSLNFPFFAVKAVSDLAEESFHCEFNRVLRDDGRFDIGNLALQAVLNPFTCLPELLRLRRRAKLASERLGEFLASCEF